MNSRNTSAKFKEKERSRQRFIRYGITEKEYIRLFHSQGGACKMCGGQERIQRRGRTQSLAVDHDHATGKIRGLLCNKCNHAVGVYEIHAEKIIKYLRTW